MDKILIIGIPAFIYYFNKVYNESKENKKLRELNDLTNKTYLEIDKVKKEISNNILEFKNNINKLNFILDKYHKRMIIIKDN